MSPHEVGRGRGISPWCLAHARRKFFDLNAASKSQFALEQFAKVYEIKRQVKQLDAD